MATEDFEGSISGYIVNDAYLPLSTANPHTGTSHLRATQTDAGAYHTISTPAVDTFGGNIEASAWFNPGNPATTNTTAIAFVRGDAAPAPASNGVPNNAYGVNVSMSGTTYTLTLRKWAGGSDAPVSGTSSLVFTGVAGAYYNYGINANGTALGVFIQRSSDNFYLTSGGTWQAGKVFCISGTDSGYSGAGYSGLAAYLPSSSSTLDIDDWVQVSSLSQVATPTFSPVAGAVASGTVVTFSSSTTGATFYYTTDGTTPTTGSTSGTSVTIISGVTVKVLAVKAGLADSAVASAAYTVISTVATPTFSPAAGAVTSGTVVTISTSTAGATLYYTTDGSTPTTASASGTTVTVSAGMTIKALAVKSGMSDSAIGSATYTITVPGTVDTPTFSPSAGAVASGTVVTFSCTTSGVTFYYTTDGTTPTTASASGTSVTITSGVTVKVIAVKSGLTNSAIASAAYTIASGSGETQTTYTDTPGLILYALFSDAAGHADANTPTPTRAYNTGTSAYEAYNAAHWANYAVAAVESPAGTYTVTIPVGARAGATTARWYLRAGGTAASTDLYIATEEFGSGTGGATGGGAVAGTAAISRLLTVQSPDGGTQYYEDGTGDLIRTRTYAGNTYTTRDYADGSGFEATYTPATGG